MMQYMNCQTETKQKTLSVACKNPGICLNLCLRLRSYDTLTPKYTFRMRLLDRSVTLQLSRVIRRVTLRSNKLHFK